MTPLASSALTCELQRGIIVTNMRITLLPMLQNLPKLSEKLLARFIEDKLANYVEPTKKGTPKGEPVGFSRTKYKATLYTLRQRVLSDGEGLEAQASKLNVSYGLLRKWRSEERFVDLVSQHEKEFSDYVLRATRESGVLKGTNAGLKASLDVLQVANSLQTLQSAVAESESDQKESLRKLILLIQGNVQQRLTKSDANPHDIKKYQRLAIDQAIELLKDRRAAMIHRKDVINLLSGVRETLS
jgi:hypothetical protein